MHYPNLFSKGKLGRRTTKNRIVLSPMGDNMANADGSVSEQSLAYYTERAKGGTGVIIPGVISVDYPRGKTIPCQHRLDDIKYVVGWERMARNIHRYGALLIPQIHHAGAATDIKTTEGMIPYRVSEEFEKTTQVGSKVDEGSFTPDQYKTLTHDEIKMLEQKFITTAKFAQMAGCDGVEIHGITYLVVQFLTKTINHRTDEYGGSLENRMRFPVNIIKGIRQECGPNFIIGIRMPVHNWDTDTFTDEDSVALARAFEAAGCDFLDTFGGIPPRLTCLIESQSYEQGDRVHLAKKIKTAVNIPVFTVGILREPDFCEKVLAEGSADFIVLGRALIADPYWPQKAKEGKASEIRRCISCLDACYGNLAKAQSISCVLNPAVGYENQLRKEPLPTKLKKVVIVGGGIAGMQAAITAAERGHKAIILEETDKLGGQLHLACVPPNKQYTHWAIEWFAGEVERKFIPVRYNCKADLETIKSLNPDVVLLATGARPWLPNIKGVENGVQAWDILSGKVDTPQNKKITVIGGGSVGCETGLYLAEKGNSVTILEMLGDIATGLEMANKLDLIEEMNNCKMTTILNATVTQIKPNKISYKLTDGSIKTLDSDVVVLSLGQKSYGLELVGELEEEGIAVEVIGDAKEPAKIINATRTGFFAALNL